jgi:hypothetical protein
MGTGRKRPGTAFLGLLAVALLEILGRLPPALPFALGSALLALYAPFRFRTRERLRRLDPPVEALAYYRMRLRLALMSARRDTVENGIRIEGGAIFEDALLFGNTSENTSGKAPGKPVLLLGWHQGPVELLHEVPAKAARGRSCFVMTASAFSPVLAEWMARKRRRAGVTVIRPEETDALRGWARDGGVLAVMVDQVPGKPEEWLSLPRSGARVPWPGRFVDWAIARHPEVFAVTARLENGRVVFRYARVEPQSIKATIGMLMDDALQQAPEQYNWSYPKVAVG